MKTVTFRLTPGLSGNQRSWCLERVETFDTGGIASSTVSWFSSIRAAKAAAAHLARKPIKLPHKITC